MLWFACDHRVLLIHVMCRGLLFLTVPIGPDAVVSEADCTSQTDRQTDRYKLTDRNRGSGCVAFFMYAVCCVMFGVVMKQAFC